MPSKNEKLDTILVLLSQVLTQGEKHMSALGGFAANEAAQLTAIQNSLTGIATGIAALDALIQKFQNSPGTLSAGDQQQLDAIVAQSTLVATQAAGISTAPPTGTSPNPPVTTGP